MNLKTTFYMLGVVLLSTLTSCLGNGDSTEYIYSPDAEITSFSLKGNMMFFRSDKTATGKDTLKIDTIKNGLEKIVFSINQLTGEIYNRDSAQYGLRLPDSILVKYTTASGYYIFDITDGDSILVQSEKDSISLSKPLKFRSYAVNGDKKDYILKFNIHQVDPDAIVWNQVNSNLDFSQFEETKTIVFNDNFYCFARVQVPSVLGIAVPINLYVSSDKALTWSNPVTINLPVASFLSSEIISTNSILSQIQPIGNELFTCSPTGELYSANISDDFVNWTKIDTQYPVVNVFGTVAKINKLALAVKKDGIIVSATFDGNNWLYGDKLPELLPAQEFSSNSYIRTNTGRLTITGGTPSAAWSTTDGLYWTELKSLPANILGANTFLYDDKFYLLNGSVGENKYNESVYTSIDGMLTWQIAPSKTYLPSSYTFRTGASVVVSSDNTIYIIGGKNNDNPVPDIWKGRLNKLN